MSQQQQPPAQQTSAPAPQVSQHPNQRSQLPPRPADQAQAPSSPHKEKAAPRVLGQRREGGNPFADPVKRRAQLDLLRADRNVEKPKESASDTNHAVSTEAGDHSEPRNSEPAAEPQPAAGNSSGSSSGGSDALSVLTAQYQARESAVQAAEAKVREATTAAERRAAEAEAAEKRSEAKLKRLEMVAHDPVQFLSDAGISKDDFKAYLTSGGAQTPEQKRLAAQELEVQKLRDDLVKMREEGVRYREKAARDAEDSLFAQQLQSSEAYTLVAAVGGIGAVRNHQGMLSKQVGKPVSLAEAAEHLESEFSGNFKKILALQTVRRKLGLQPTGDKPAREAKPQARTLDGAHSSSTPSTHAAKPKWNDWKGKLEIFKREQQRAQRQ